MARKLSAYNMHVASYVRAHPGMARKEAFRAAAASWSGKSTKRNPDIKIPGISGGSNDIIKWGLIGLAAYLILPKLLSGMQQAPATKNDQLANRALPMRTLRF